MFTLKAFLSIIICIFASHLKHAWWWNFVHETYSNFCGALTKIILFRELRDPPVNLFSENSLWDLPWRWQELGLHLLRRSTNGPISLQVRQCANFPFKIESERSIGMKTSTLSWDCVLLRWDSNDKRDMSTPIGQINNENEYLKNKKIEINNPYE